MLGLSDHDPDRHGHELLVLSHVLELAVQLWDMNGLRTRRFGGHIEKALPIRMLEVVGAGDHGRKVWIRWGHHGACLAPSVEGKSRAEARPIGHSGSVLP